MRIGTGGGQQGLIEVTGHWNCFEVYAQLPSPAWRNVRVQAHCMVGNGMTVVGDTLLSRVTGQFTPQGEAGGFTALVFSIRGRSCERFRLVAVDVPEGVIEPAMWWCYSWGEGDVYGDMATRLPVELFASGARRVNGLVTLTPDATAGTLVTANPDGGQTALTHLAITSSDTTPRLVTLSYQVGADPPVVTGSWWVVSGGPVVVDFTYPLRSARGGAWLVSVAPPPAALTSVVVEAVGFYE